MESNISISEIPVKDKKGFALASLILGLVGIIAWFIPLIGYPVTISGLVLGILGRKSSRGKMAVAGIILSIIFLLVTTANAVIGMILITQMMQKQ